MSLCGPNLATCRTRPMTPALLSDLNPSLSLVTVGISVKTLSDSSSPDMEIVKPGPKALDSAHSRFLERYLREQLISRGECSVRYVPLKGRKGELCR